MDLVKKRRITKITSRNQRPHCESYFNHQGNTGIFKFKVKFGPMRVCFKRSSKHGEKQKDRL